MTTTCRHCHRPRRHRARNLCTPCWRHHHHAGTLHHYPRTRLDPDTFRTEYTHLHRLGLTPTAIAQALHMRPNTLHRRLQRYRAAGTLTIDREGVLT